MLIELPEEKEKQ